MGEENKKIFWIIGSISKQLVYFSQNKNIYCLSIILSNLMECSVDSKWLDNFIPQ